MSVEKLNGKWYIRGKIKLDDGGYYEYRQIARGCRGKKEAQEYERIFRKKYKDIQVSKNFKTFREISTEYLNSLTSQKKIYATLLSGSTGLHKFSIWWQTYKFDKQRYAAEVY